MSSFISVQLPPGGVLKTYDPSKRHDDQPSADSFPETFLDAMSVREDVYVDEQKVPLEYELDAEDAQSIHWVAYASVSTSGAVNASDDRKGSGGKLAIGTVRLVLPPHVHDENGHNEGPNMDGVAEGEHAETLGCLRRGNEPYARMGRLAVLKPYRKMGLSSLLVNAALEYATNHPDEILPPVSPTEMEHRRLEATTSSGLDEHDEWDGLVLVHAQSAIEKLWRAWGFVRDQTMGEWNEEGIMHVGMWRRIPVVRRRASVIGSPN
ncbi:hypothetical protein K461DRAFT_271930 [Myriangium duriaei CBS 260.36]|uniref:N-acetyltransferase domain-containing protein n=1 Tax=Myriangium duriaei CBS 260.36 TaxID=1168546 RepID=A0A9P4ITX1_9PEZI|nr:hypothetical protein K461DRAFT_271930 [Myriangium duriaei CBS 260.36]